MLKKKKENFSRKVISYALSLNSPIYHLKTKILKGYENSKFNNNKIIFII
jgi:hypothetical protein